MRLFKNMTDLLVAVTVLPEGSVQRIQLSMKALLAADGSGSMCQSGQHRMHIGVVVV
jgi:hypothetical protein